MKRIFTVEVLRFTLVLIYMTNVLDRLKKINKVFLGTVVIPTAIAVIYFGVIAQDVYISESRFVVRSPERQSTSALGFILKGAGFSRSQDDSYTVQNFILSRDAMHALDREMQLKSVFSKAGIDIVNRFPGLDSDDSYESLHRYYQKMVGVQLDSLSSITTLTTRAFSAEESKRMNQLLLEHSESLLNQLNERGRQDLIRFAADEVAQAQKNAAAAALALARYRNDKEVINPEVQSAIPLQQAAKLRDELIATKAQVLQLQTLAKDNPQLPVLRQRVQLLESEIQSETTRVAGAGDKSLAGKAATFQRLALEKEFSDKMLASAMSTLEQARNEAQRKQLYLERIVQPSTPDNAMEPRRLRSIVAVFLLGLIAWGVATMLIAGIKEHQD